MRLTRIFRAFADETRLRVLWLLSERPLCVSHLQSILEASQVQISKHLLYLKKNGLVESRVAKNWRVYQLAAPADQELQRCLECLRDCVRQANLFAADLARLRAMTPDLEASGITAGRAPIPKPRPSQPEQGPSEHLENHLL